MKDKLTTEYRLWVIQQLSKSTVSVSDLLNETPDWWLSRINTNYNDRATTIKWDDSKDELYTYFGKCECGETSVIVGSNYCHHCGTHIINPLRR